MATALHQLQGNVRRAAWRPEWALLLPVLALALPGITGFPYPSPDAPYSDLAVSHYPYTIYLRRALLEWGQVPLWAPGILSGAPFAANPLSGLWYPPGWAALLLPLPFGLNLVAALHLLWGGLGMFRLLRAEGLGTPAALFGGLAFECLPKLWAHFGAGHLTLLYAVSWTPWLLWSVGRGRGSAGYDGGVRETGPGTAVAGHGLAPFNGGPFSSPPCPYPRGRWIKLDPLPAVLLALIFLADPRWAPLAGLAWAGYSLARRPEGRSLPAAVLGLAGQAALAGLLAAPLALPLLEYARLSTRFQMQASDVLTLSLPPANLLGLLFPAFGGLHEHMLYAGAGGLALALLAVLWGAVRRRAGYWAALAGLSLLYALGENLPGLPLLAELPGIDLLRVPARALYLTGIGLVALAAFAAQRLVDGLGPTERRRGNLLLGGLAAFSLALAGGVLALNGGFPLPFVWGAGSLAVFVIWTVLRTAGRVPARPWLVGATLLLLADLLVVDASLFAYRPVQDGLSNAYAAARSIAAQPGGGRVYSPSYSLPQHIAAAYGLELADGVDPLQLQSYADFMSPATGVPASGYSVTLPAYAGGDPIRDNAAYRPDPRRLGLLNVRWVLAEFDLPVEGLALRDTFGSTRLYENELALPRLWLQPANASPGVEAAPVERFTWTPNRVTVEVDIPPGEPQLLVLAEVIYPGWEAAVDGRPAEILAAAGLLRAVLLDPGPHQVTFNFRPRSVFLGLALAALGGVIVLVLAWRNFQLRPYHPANGDPLEDRP